MKIAIGGLKKEEMKAAIERADSSIEVIVSSDMAAIPLLRNGEVDYYFGACESGGGAAISILIGAIGYSKCGIVCKNGETPSEEKISKIANEDKVVFGMAHDKIDVTVPILINVLKQK